MLLAEGWSHLFVTGQGFGSSCDNSSQGYAWKRKLLLCCVELLLYFGAVCQQFSPPYLTRMIIVWFGMGGHEMVSWISCQPRQYFHHWVLSPAMTLFLYKTSCFAPSQPSQAWGISINRPKKLQVTPALRKLTEVCFKVPVHRAGAGRGCFSR